MTTVDEARAAVHSRWDTQWGTTTPFVFENEDEKTFDSLGGGAVAWAYLIVRNVGGGQETLGPTGNRNFDRRGAVVVELRTPKDRGMKAGAALAHQARAIFEGASFSGLDFTNGQVRENGSDGKWYRHSAEIVFTYYETK